MTCPNRLDDDTSCAALRRDSHISPIPGADFLLAGRHAPARKLRTQREDRSDADRPGSARRADGLADRGGAARTAEKDPARADRRSAAGARHPRPGRSRRAGTRGWRTYGRARHVEIVDARGGLFSPRDQRCRVHAARGNESHAEEAGDRYASAAASEGAGRGRRTHRAAGASASPRRRSRRRQLQARAHGAPHLAALRHARALTRRARHAARDDVRRAGLDRGRRLGPDAAEDRAIGRRASFDRSLRPGAPRRRFEARALSLSTRGARTPSNPHEARARPRPPTSARICRGRAGTPRPPR